MHHAIPGIHTWGRPCVCGAEWKINILGRECPTAVATPDIAAAAARSPPPPSPPRPLARLPGRRRRPRVPHRRQRPHRGRRRPLARTARRPPTVAAAFAPPALALDHASLRRHGSCPRSQPDSTALASKTSTSALQAKSGRLGDLVVSMHVRRTSTSTCTRTTSRNTDTALRTANFAPGCSRVAPYIRMQDPITLYRSHFCCTKRAYRWASACVEGNGDAVGSKGQGYHRWPTVAHIR